MVKKLTTYEDFIARVETLGFMTLSQVLPGFPSLAGETNENFWHTGTETDPWRWKDRAAEEKHLAYGSILGGHNGFISRSKYPVFYAAFNPTTAMEERWTAGTINRLTWQLWQLFESHDTLNVSQIRKSLDVSRKRGASAADAAIKKLQQEFYITMDGNEQKISNKGKAYGWPVNRYRRVINWVPAGWLDNTGDWSVAAAKEKILNDAVEISDGVNRRDLAKKLGL